MGEKESVLALNTLRITDEHKPCSRGDPTEEG